MAEILNQNAYTLLQNRIAAFNARYGKEWKNQYKRPFTYVDFESVAFAWTKVGALKKNNDKPSIPNTKNNNPDGWLTKEQFNEIKGELAKVYDKFKFVAKEKNLGETNINEKGQTELDYTRISEEFLEIGVLYLHAFTGLMDQLRYHREASDPDKKTEAFLRSREIFDALYNPNMHFDGLPVLEETSLVGAIRLELSGALVPKIKDPDNNIVPEKKHARTYKDYMTEREANIERQRKENEKREAEERAANEARERQAQLERAQREKEAEEQEYREKQERDYLEVKTAFPRQTGVPEIKGIEGSFYKYYEEFQKRMGLEGIKYEAYMTPQTLLKGMGQVLLGVQEKNGSLDEFKKQARPLYNQLRRVTFEAYINKCVKDNTPINLDVAAEEVHNLMGVLMYTSDPTALDGEKFDIEAQMRLQAVWSGQLNSAEKLLAPDERRIVMEQMKRDYLQDPQVTESLTADANARYDEFAAQGKSSGTIVRESRDAISAYTAYAQTRNNADAEHSPFAEAELKKTAFDAAYALEKRVETRYASKVSRFFRFISYRRQSNQLAAMKKALGVPADARIADKIVESRANDLFRDSAPERAYDRGEKMKGLTTEKTLSDVKEVFAKYAGDLPKTTQLEMNDKKLERINDKDQYREYEEQRAAEHEEKLYDDDLELPTNKHMIEQKKAAEREKEEKERLDIEKEKARQEELRRREQAEEQKYYDEQKNLVGQLDECERRIENARSIINSTAKINERLQRERLAEAERLKGELKALAEEEKSIADAISEKQEEINVVTNNQNNLSDLINEKSAAIMSSEEYAEALLKVQSAEPGSREMTAATDAISDLINKNPDIASWTATRNALTAEADKMIAEKNSLDAKLNNCRDKQTAVNKKIEEKSQIGPSEKANQQTIYDNQKTIEREELQKSNLLNKIDKDMLRTIREEGREEEDVEVEHDENWHDPLEPFEDEFVEERTSISINELSENKNIARSPKVIDERRSPQKSIQK